MDAILLQILNGLDKGSAYALIALGLTLIFGTLGVVNFAHGALFMLGAFTAVTFREILTMQKVVLSETETTAWGTPLEIHTPYAQIWFGDFGQTLIDYSVPMSILLAIPVMLADRPRHRARPDQALLQAPARRPDPRDLRPRHRAAGDHQGLVRRQPDPAAGARHLRGMVDVGVAIGMTPGNVVYPLWRFVYFTFAVDVIGGVFASSSSPPSAWWCAPAWPTARPWASSASTSTGASPGCSASPRWSPGSPA